MRKSEIDKMNAAKADAVKSDEVQRAEMKMLFALYCSRVGSVDFTRRVETPRAICAAAIKEARIALDVWKQESGKA